VTSHSWCQITPFTQSCIRSSEILPPQMKMWPPHRPPQTTAARNAHERQRSAAVVFEAFDFLCGLHRLHIGLLQQPILEVFCGLAVPSSRKTLHPAPFRCRGRGELVAGVVWIGSKRFSTGYTSFMLILYVYIQK